MIFSQYDSANFKETIPCWFNPLIVRLLFLNLLYTFLLLMLHSNFLFSILLFVIYLLMSLYSKYTSIICVWLKLLMKQEYQRLPVSVFIFGLVFTKTYISMLSHDCTSSFRVNITILLSSLGNSLKDLLFNSSIRNFSNAIQSTFINTAKESHFCFLFYLKIGKY